MNPMWKTGAQAGLIMLAGGALLLTGGVASAAPGEAHAECSVVQLPGVDLQLGQPGSCVSVLLPPDTKINPPGPVTNPAPPEPVAAVMPAAPTAAPPAPVGDASPPAPVGNASPPAPVGDASPPAPVGDASPPVPTSAPAQAQSPPYPCLDVQLPGLRISVGDANPPTQCFVAQAT